MLPLLSTLSPNAAVLILTLGVVLIAVELNRPGWIVPGAFGLLLTLLTLAVLFQRRPAPLALALLLCAAVILLLQPICRVRLWIVCVSAAAGVAGFAMLPQVRLAVAILCGLVLSAGTTILTRIARRARLNKGLD